MNWWEFGRKSNVQTQRRNALRASQRLTKGGAKLSPVALADRTIASSVWGKAWCDNLESYRDFEYRLPRGRSYVRHGAVIDLQVSAGHIVGLVCGSEVYTVQITVKPLPQAHWSRIKSQCAGQVSSLIELLEGRLSEAVMRIITHREGGLFPKPPEIQMTCSCPDSATMCKHVAAVMYGVGARLDHQPELLFALRNTNHADLIAQAADFEVSGKGSGRKTIANDALASVFGIEIDVEPETRPAAAKPRGRKVGVDGVAKGGRKKRVSKR
jgi:uncharacterized Zn finger protein